MYLDSHDVRKALGISSQSLNQYVSRKKIVERPVADVDGVRSGFDYASVSALILEGKKRTGKNVLIEFSSEGVSPDSINETMEKYLKKDKIVFDTVRYSSFDSCTEFLKFISYVLFDVMNYKVKDIYVWSEDMLSDDENFLALIRTVLSRFGTRLISLKNRVGATSKKKIETHTFMIGKKKFSMDYYVRNSKDGKDVCVSANDILKALGKDDMNTIEEIEDSMHLMLDYTTGKNNPYIAISNVPNFFYYIGQNNDNKDIPIDTITNVMGAIMRISNKR